MRNQKDKTEKNDGANTTEMTFTKDRAYIGHTRKTKQTKQTKNTHAVSDQIARELAGI